MQQTLNGILVPPKTRVVESFAGSRAKVQEATRSERIRPFYPRTPRICATEGLKKMGWVMVGESLLSAGVIAPGVGAHFLSTGICRARAQVRLHPPV